MMEIRKVKIAGTGSYLPEKILTNADLEKMVDTTDDWIRTRTGISERRIAEADQATSDLAAESAKRAIQNAGIMPEDIDLIIVATLSPDMPFPSTACLVQNLIGASNATCFDLSAACTGFLYALRVAEQFVACGSMENVLVIGAEKLSSVTDWEDRSTCVLFGDGAGAAVVQATADECKGIISSFMGSDGSLADLLNIPAGGSRLPASQETVLNHLHCMKMSGNEVFKHAVRCMCDAGQKALEQCGMTIEDVDCIIPHQANMRIIKAIGNRLKGSSAKFYNNLERVGNMSAASIPVALDEAIKAGKLTKGNIVLFIAFGGGFTWGATVIEL